VILAETIGTGHVFVDDAYITSTASNQTPDKETVTGNWIDDKFARAILQGAGHDVRARWDTTSFSGD